MRTLAIIGLAAIALAGCDPKKPVPLDMPPRQNGAVSVEERALPAEQAPPAAVEIGGPQGGIHVNDPAGGTRVDIGGGSGVQVRTPDSNVNVP